MTTGPTDVKVTTAADGPDGMPLALRFSEGLGPNAQDVERDPTHAWTLAQRCELAAKCLPPAEYRARLERLHADMLAEIGQLRHALAQSGKLAGDRLQQMKADRAQALRWRDQLDSALTVCRCAGRVIDSSAYQGISDEDCDLEVAVRNWRALGPNVRAEAGPTAKRQARVVENAPAHCAGLAF